MKEFLQPLSRYWHAPDQTGLRRPTIILAMISLVVLLGIIVVHGYSTLRFQILLGNSEEALSEGNLELAHAFLYKASFHNPDHPNFLNLAVKLAEEQNSLHYRYWLNRLGYAQPNNPDIKLKQLRLALNENEIPRVNRLLGELESLGSRPGEVANIKAILAIRQGQEKLATSFFQEALKGKPESVMILNNYLAHLIAHPGESTREKIESLIDTLGKMSGGQYTAVRHRIVYYNNQREGDKAIRLSKQLLESPEANSTDWAENLRLLARYQPDKYLKDRDHIFKQITTSPKNSRQVLQWLINKGALEDAEHMLGFIPSNAQNSAYFIGAVAELSHLQSNWDRLENLINNGQWGKREDLRLAYASELALAQGQPEIAEKIRWKAIRASPSPESLFDLLKHGQAWPEWKASEEPLLLRLATDSRWEYAALQGLAAIYFEQRDSESLLKIQKTLHELYPAKRNHQMLYASLALLCGKDISRAIELIEDLRTALPDNPVISCLYARSLYIMRKQSAAAEEILKIDESERFRPDIALYTAYILSSNPEYKGQVERALRQVEPDILIDKEKALYEETLQNLRATL